MEKLDLGKRLVFANVREYYETLGFLCKEKEVIKIYIEDNRKAGARGIQGRLRIVEGNYKSFPKPLKELFEKSKDKHPSVTDYVRNLQKIIALEKRLIQQGNSIRRGFIKLHWKM